MANGKPKTGKRAGAIVIAISLACAMFGTKNWTQIGLLGIGIEILLLYGLAGWVTKPRLSVAERIGRSIALFAAVSVAVAWFSWQFRPGWHLDSTQEDALAAAAKKIPKNIWILVELPENSIAGQEYGDDIWRVLHDNGANVNSLKMFHVGIGNPIEGVIVSARYRNDPAYNYASGLQYEMMKVQIPAIFHEGNTWADASSFIIYVGSKPVE